MEILGTIINATVVGTVGLVLGWIAKGRFEAIERRFDEVDRRFADVGRRMDEFQRSLDAMRSDLTNVALAVGASPRASGQDR